MFVNLRPSYKRSPQMKALIATNLGMACNPYLVGLQIDQKRLRNLHGTRLACSLHSSAEVTLEFTVRTCTLLMQ